MQKPVGEMMFQPGRLMTIHPDNRYFHSTMPWPCHIPSDKWPVQWIEGKYPPTHPHPFPNVQLTVHTVYWAASISPANCPRHAECTVSCTLPHLYPPFFPHSLDLNRRWTLEKLVETGVWSTGKIKALYPRRQRINHVITPRIWTRSPVVRNADAGGPTISQRMLTLQLGYPKMSSTGGWTWAMPWNGLLHSLWRLLPSILEEIPGLLALWPDNKIPKKYLPTASRVKPLAPPPFTLI